MYFRKLLPALSIATVASLAAVTYAAIIRAHDIALLAAAGFAFAIVASGLWLRQKFIAQQNSQVRLVPEAASRRALQQTTYLTTLTYAWCAAALFLCYPIIGLPWRHGWQYGTGFLLTACAFAVYLSRLKDERDPLAQPTAVNTAVGLAALQAGVSVATLGWVVLSGKLATLKNDWAANDIFLAGGLTILCLSITLITTHRRLMRG